MRRAFERCLQAEEDMLREKLRRFGVEISPLRFDHQSTVSYRLAVIEHMRSLVIALGNRPTKDFRPFNNQ